MIRHFNTIPVTFFDDIKKYELTTDQLLTYLYLLLCRATNNIGTFQQDTETISYYTGISIPETEKIMDSLVDKELLYRFEANWLFVVYRWHCESKASIKNLLGAYSELRKLPDHIMKVVKCHHEDIVTAVKDYQLKKAGIRDSEYIAHALSDDPDPIEYHNPSPFYTEEHRKKSRPHSSN